MSVDASDLRARSYTRHRKRDERFMYKEVYDFAKLRQGFYDAKHGKFHNPAENKFEIRLLEALVILSDRTRRKLKKMKKKLDAGQITMEKIDEFYTSWRSYAAGGDTYHLLQKMDAIYNSLFNQTETGGETNVLY